MNIPEGYKLVPVEPTDEMLEVLHSNVKIQVDTLERTASIINDKEWWASVVEVATASPQPIYDEAKERELFAEFSKRIILYDSENFPIRWCDCVPDDEIEDHLNTWLACAQSRAKAGEVGDE